MPTRSSRPDPGSPAGWRSTPWATARHCAPAPPRPPSPPWRPDSAFPPTHTALRALLAACDGVVPRRASNEAGAFLIGYSLLDTEKVLERQRHLAARAEDAVEEGYEDEVGRTAHTRWVPFAQALTGDPLFVDHRQDGYGTVCEISFGDPDHRRPWPGLGAMLDDLADAMEEGTLLHTVGRRPTVHEGRMLQWPTL